jgi:KipI family sensor histidine kinase inhibitor
MTSAQIVAAGDAALLVRLANRPGLGASRRVLALVAALDATPPPGLLDVIPAYASVLVRFDPLTLEPAAMAACLCAALARSVDAPAPRGRLVRIPVRYGGSDGPDLDDVAHALGLSAAELIQRHTAASYRVAFLGFLAGFPYLSGLPRALVVPRLSTPRTHVPAGSVAIAERQAGVYPAASPGGWRILGRTALPLFDPACDPPALMRPGDRVRFYSVAADDLHAAAPIRREPGGREDSELPWLRVIEPGLQTTIQDGGRVGYARYGVSASGAADPDALTLAAALLANPPDTAALEITGGAARFAALGSCVVALMGAPCDVAVNGRRKAMGEAFALASGDILDVGAVSVGLRAYLCVAGGIAVPLVMGSRASDLRAGLGGLAGRALRRGDKLARGPASDEAEGRIVSPDVMSRLPTNADWRLRILPGPHRDRSPGALEALTGARFTVDARSDRVGVRLRCVDGPCMAGGQTLSEGLPRGAVQLPPDGEPVLLLAEAQATGGYHVPAIVISADLWRLGQLRPGDTVRFQSVSLDDALAALRRRRDVIAAIRRSPAPARLLSGFAEWSDEDDEEVEL